MYGLVTLRTAFMVCVPLFIILTGYLMSKKELCRKYYKGIVKTISIYVLASICCILFSIFYQHQEVSFKEAIFKIFNFTGASYSWYVNMYIGLFLLIPFLNILWKGIKDKRGKLALIVSLLICCTLPSILNIFDFFTPGFWQNPQISTTYNNLVPNWWTAIYPIAYYFIGAYLKEFDIKIKISKNILFFILSVLLFGLFNYYRSYSDVFQWGTYNGWGGFQNVIMSVLFFSILLHLDLKRLPRILKVIIMKVSEISLGIYLVSSIFDQYAYPQLIEQVSSIPDRIKYYPFIVPFVFVSSAVLSQILMWIHDGGSWLLTAASRKLIKKSE